MGLSKTACAIAARLAVNPFVATSQGVSPFEHVLTDWLRRCFFVLPPTWV
ncbi:MAG: hypothetical protein IPN81_14225 [Nitrosomonadales bacterium]|nr:hypothetical protein [Nitrosomonadales bacterium]